MSQQVAVSVENNFTKGLVTDSTALNFPENAATDCDNTEFNIIGGVNRRLGINRELNGVVSTVDRTNKAVSTYKWNNAGGDGLTQIVVTQIGSTLYFYRSSSATEASPLSTTKLASTVNLTGFLPAGSSRTIDDLECTYADGNGYLFVYHTSLDPFYCTYTNGTITATVIPIKTRDFTGIPETADVAFRPPAPITDSHYYNIQNQGWQSPPSFTATSTTGPNLIPSGPYWTITNTTFQVQPGLSVIGGQYVTIYGGIQFTTTTANYTIQGQVTAYSGTSLSVNVISVISSPNVLIAGNNFISANWTITSAATNNYIQTWLSAVGNYPSNADTWWVFKNTSGVFDPTTTINNFPAPSAPANKGHFILNEFNQTRAQLAGVTNLTTILTYARPRVGTWFQGRVWYAGVDDSFQPTGTAPYTTWTENIYFSQVVVKADQFGNCFQENDPTDQNFFDILPTDGGVIQIQGSGSVFKLFPIQNGLLVFAANGVWYITGSQGIGFTANDYTITKLSSIESISSTSFVDVQGLPYFWNEEGIYAVQPQQGGGLAVNNIIVDTLLKYYETIPKQSKKYARGVYDPIGYCIQWLFKSSNDISVTDRYSFDKILNFNTYNKAFYPYTVDNSVSSLNGITFIQSPGGTNTAPPAVKYFMSSGTDVSFAQEYDENYVDWASYTPTDYVSYFIAGYKLRGKGMSKFQSQYVQVWHKTNNGALGYNIQGIWDYANEGNSGRWSNTQQIRAGLNRFDYGYRRHKIRGHGYSLQIKISSVSGLPFDLSGWAMVDTINQGA